MFWFTFNDKFGILDEIKEIKTRDKSQITLSVAISNEGDSNYEKIRIINRSRYNNN